MQTIDLHAHTTASDGSLTPTELVVLAAEEGLEAVGITDHDTIEGLPEAAEAARQLNVELVTGVELSVSYPAGRCHLLGYLMAPDSSVLSARLRHLQQNRASRNERMVRRLQEMGLGVSMGDVVAESGGGQVGRPHMAAALARKGLASSVRDAFDRFVGDQAPGYIPKERVTLEQGISLLHEAGALAVLAHPNSLALSDAELERELRAMRGLGLDGLECYYSLHTPERTDMLLDLARRVGLLATGGSDFHGGAKPEIQLGQVVGGRPAPTALLYAMKERQAELAARAVQP